MTLKATHVPQHTYALMLLPPSPSFSPLNLKETLLTQCLSSAAPPKPSPLNTCPRWPPQFAQITSVLRMPKFPSSRRSIAPDTPSKKAGHPDPLSNLLVLLYSGALQPAQV